MGKQWKPGREIKLDDFDKRALSRLVLGLYTRTPSPEIPTVTRIYEESQIIAGFPQIGRIKLHKESKKLGIVYKSRNKKRLDIVAQRQKYLRKITHVRAFGYKTFYQDETWCNANHTREYIW